MPFSVYCFGAGVILTFCQKRNGAVGDTMWCNVRSDILSMQRTVRPVTQFVQRRSDILSKQRTVRSVTQCQCSTPFSPFSKCVTSVAAKVGKPCWSMPAFPCNAHGLKH